MGLKIITVGDNTDHGGEVVGGSPLHTRLVRAPLLAWVIWLSVPSTIRMAERTA